MASFISVYESIYIKTKSLKNFLPLNTRTITKELLSKFLYLKISHYQDMQPERGYHSRPTSTAASTTSTSWSSMTPGGQQFPQLSLCTPASGQPKPSDFLGSNHPTVVRGHKTASVAAASSLSLPHTSKSNAAAAVLQQRLE